MHKSNHLTVANAVKGKIIYVLGIVILVQFSYPITESGNFLTQIIYQMLYATLFIAGIVLSRHKPKVVRLLSVTGVVWLIVTIITYIPNQTSLLALLITYVIFGFLQIIITLILLQYVFQARHITRDVIYAAIAIYLLLGAIFVPTYGLIETLTFALSDGTAHAFTGGTLVGNGIFAWQDFIYYSYVTLTTLGFGDILPVTMLAKSAVTLEAVIGVMYVTIIMARLVSLYSADTNKPTTSQNE